MVESLAVQRSKDAVTLARVREIVEQFAERDRLGEIITAVHHIPARDPKFAPMPEWVRVDLTRAYGEKGALFASYTPTGLRCSPNRSRQS